MNRNPGKIGKISVKHAGIKSMGKPQNADGEFHQQSQCVFKKKWSVLVSSSCMFDTNELWCGWMCSQ
jgi:hypothetical protein